MTDKKPLNIDIQSEIGELQAVLLHTPGAEVENMTPKMAQRALYSDILNLSIAQEEYAQLSGVLQKLAKVYTVSDLLVKVLDNDAERQALIGKICVMEQVTDYFDMLMDMSSVRLAKVLIEGLPAKINTLTSFLNEDYYALFPLYNFYFTRDAAVTIGDNALICKMANKVRTRESLIMEAIYKGSGEFNCGIINAYDYQPGNHDIYMEGGDILIARDDILLLGNGARTSTQGIDLLAARLLNDFADICNGIDGKCGYRFPAGVSTFGRQLEWDPDRLASPHGKKAGDILAANCSPTPGSDREGATAIIRSYCKADLSRLATGSALDVKLLPL